MATIIENKRAEIERVIAERKAAAKEARELKKLDIELARINSASFITAEARAEDTATLEATMEVYKDTVAEYNETAPKDKQGKVQKSFMFGHQGNLIVAMAVTATYAREAYKQELLDATNWTMDMLETFEDARGSAPYYSKLTGEVVEGVKGDASKLETIMVEMAQAAGTTITEFPKVNATVLHKEQVREQVRAEEFMMNSDRYAEEHAEVAEVINKLEA